MHKFVLPLYFLLLLAVSIIYLPTLQVDINGSSEAYMIDVGEIQGALSTWGTMHPSGYPAYTIIGNVLTGVFRSINIPLAIGATLVSLLSSMGVLTIIYWLGQRISHPLAGLATAILLAVVPVYWLNSVIAEVYTFHLLWSFLSLALAWFIRETKNARLLSWLALCMGIAIAHHRTAVLFLPSVAYLVWPICQHTHWRQWAMWVGAFLLPFMAYIYLPLRGFANAVWLYGSPHEWSDFWYIFLSQEYRAFMVVPTSWSVIQAQWQHLLAMMHENVPCFSVIGFLGVLSGLKEAKTRPFSIALFLLALAFTLFSFLYNVPDESSIIMPIFVVPLLGIPLLIAQFSKPYQNWGAFLLLVLVVSYMANGIHGWRGEIATISQNPMGRELITAASRVDSPHPNLISRWGVEWFAYRYGHYVTKELATAAIWEPHTNPRVIWANDERVFVSKDFFYQESLMDWQEKYGPFYLQSAGWGMMELLAQPQTQPPPTMIEWATPMGSEFRLLGYQWHIVDSERWLLTLYWQAITPSPNNYSIFVHLVSHMPPRNSNDILAQADSQHPVYGWYPTSAWTAEEIVRDDYLLVFLAGAVPTAVRTGFYTQNSATGVFENLGEAVIPLPEFEVTP